MLKCAVVNATIGYPLVNHMYTTLPVLSLSKLRLILQVNISPRGHWPFHSRWKLFNVSLLQIHQKIK